MRCRKPAQAAPGRRRRGDPGRAAGLAGHLERLGRADLAVGVLEQGGHRPRHRHRTSPVVEVDPAGAVHPDRLRSRSSRRMASAAWRPGTRTAECSTAEATTRVPRRRPAYLRPSAIQRTAVGPSGAKATSEGRTPSPAASTSRAWSSSRRAVRASRCRRRGSAHPASIAASIVSLARGCIGPGAASRTKRWADVVVVHGPSGASSGEGFATPRR